MNAQFDSTVLYGFFLARNISVFARPGELFPTFFMYAVLQLLFGVFSFLYIVTSCRWCCLATIWCAQIFLEGDAWAFHQWILDLTKRCLTPPKVREFAGFLVSLLSWWGDGYHGVKHLVSVPYCTWDHFHWISATYSMNFLISVFAYFALILHFKHVYAFPCMYSILLFALLHINRI